MPPESVRAKMICTSLRKYRTNLWENGKSREGFLYSYEFNPVTGGSPENEKFFGSTPSGRIELSAIRDDLFEPGRAYYLDFSPAEV